MLIMMEELGRRSENNIGRSSLELKSPYLEM